MFRKYLYYKENVMKATKKMFTLLLALIMVLSLFPAVASAEAKDDIPTKVRMFYTQDESAIKLQLADTTQSIDNIKTDSKNLFAMLTGSEMQQSSDVESNQNSFTIGLRSEKNGTYTVSFDVVDKDGKKVSTKEIKVYAYDVPVKSISFNGKNMRGNTLTGKSAKVKVALTTGNVIKKLEYGVYKIKDENDRSNSEMEYTEFKNGSTVTFGTKAYYNYNKYTNSYDGESAYESEYFYTGMDCPTQIQITYFDKYTKQNETITEYFYKPVE
jgi:methionine-rich copper-binding protein CopC